MLALLSVALAAPVPADSLLNEPGRPWAVQLNVEAGFVAPLTHTIHLGQAGSEFDYVAEGGQNNLFFVTRWSADLLLRDRHRVTLLYQPLNLRTEVRAQRDLVFDDVQFAAGTPLALRYGFDFYRASYTFDVLESDDALLGLGASLQIRNATIDFADVAGTGFDSSRDVGPVPVLKAIGRFDYSSGGWWGFEVDGFYAPIKYVNGGNSDVVGAIVDASVRAGLRGRTGLDPFVNLRWIGGGAEGTQSDPDPGKDGFVRNWLNFATVSIGVQVR